MIRKRWLIGATALDAAGLAAVGAILYESLNVHLIARSGAPFLGAAEASIGPTKARARQCAHTQFDATCQRVRGMPPAGDKLRRLIEV